MGRSCERAVPVLREQGVRSGRTLGRVAAITPSAHRSSAVRYWPFFLLTVLGCGFVQSDLAPGVSPGAIRAIRLGMDLETVIDTLGVPLSVSAVHGAHSKGCRSRPERLERDVSSGSQLRLWLDSLFKSPPCCESNKGERVRRQVTLLYSRMVEEDGVSPMLWVHFELDRVRAVAAALNSHSPFRDDQGIYLLSNYRRQMPDGDEKTVRSFHCEEDLLQEYFSQ